MKRILLYVATLGLLSSMITCACAGKATTPAEVVDKVKVGMTVEEVLDNVDQDYFLQNDRFVSINVAELDSVSDVLDYEDVLVWLFFGSIMQAVDPAALAFRGDTVVAVGRISFDEALKLAQWQSSTLLTHW